MSKKIEDYYGKSFNHVSFPKEVYVIHKLTKNNVLVKWKKGRKKNQLVYSNSTVLDYFRQGAWELISNPSTTTQ